MRREYGTGSSSSSFVRTTLLPKSLSIERTLPVPPPPPPLHRLGISSADKRQQREGWLDPPPGQYEKPAGVDGWTEDGMSWQLEAKQVKIKVD